MRAPSSGGGPASRLAWWGLAAALMLGAFLRFWQLPTQSLFIDEAFTVEAARLSPHALLQFLAAHDAHPPLFYLWAHAAETLLHWPSTWYRFLTASFGLLTIGATWALVRRLSGDIAAVAAAIFIATEPTLLLFDRMFRMYGILTALGVVSFWLLAKALDAQAPHRRVWWIAYVVVAALLPSIQYLGALILASQAVYALVDVRRRWPVFAACGLGALALVPWWWGIKEQWPQAGFAGGHSGTVDWFAARTVLGYALPVEWYRSPQFDVVFSLCVLAVLLAGLVIMRGGLLGVYLLPLFLQAAMTWVFHRNLLYGRYLIYLIPAFAAAFGAVTAALAQSRLRIGGLALVVAALAINGVADTDFLVDKFYQLSDWNLVESLMVQNEQKSDVIVFDQRYPYLVMRSSPVLEGHDFTGPELQQEVPPILRWLDQRARERVWYIENQPQFPDPNRLIRKHLDATRKRLREWLEPRAEPNNIVYIALYGPMQPRKR